MSLISIALFFFFLGAFTRLPEIIGSIEKKEWTISPYPNGHDFAFTIIHDADDAYSERLRPLFEVFDKYGFKITLTVFSFWGDDTVNRELFEKTPEKERIYCAKAVPLEVRSEQIFYKTLVANGHEIGLHSATNLSDDRKMTKNAFEYFQDIFGHYPKIYVEHRSRDNKECLQREGADPESEFYIVDILNRYRPWTWIIAPSALPYEGRGNYFNVLDPSILFFSDTALKCWGILRGVVKNGRIDLENGELYLRMVKRGSPFDEYVLRKYGIIKGFRRTGTSKNADGDGFLQWYSKKNVNKLEKDRGAALVYTHLNSRWLDQKTKKMRDEIRERLQYIASKDVWLAPASEILDRLKAISNIHVSYDQNWVKVVNAGDCQVSGLTLISRKGKCLMTMHGERLQVNDQNEIIVGAIEPKETICFKICD